jgi:hypothetical protein
LFSLPHEKLDYRWQQRAQRTKLVDEYAIQHKASSHSRVHSPFFFPISQGNAAVKVGDWQLALANYNTAMDIDPSVYTYPLNASLMHLKLLQ